MKSTPEKKPATTNRPCRLVLGCTDLDRGSAWLARFLGMPMGPVQREPAFATQERQLCIGNDGMVLSLMACDSSLTTAQARWFGLDTEEVMARIQNRPALIGWGVAASDDAHFDAQVAALDGVLGGVVTLADSRRVTSPVDGHPLEGGLVPQLFSRPEKGASSGCRFTWMEAAHPNPAKVQYLLGELGVPKSLVLTGSPPYSGMTMCAYVEGPAGKRTLMS